MRDGDRGPAAGHRVQGALQPHLGRRVDGAGRLVEHQQVGVGHVGPDQRDELPLADATAPRRARPTGVCEPGRQAATQSARPELGEGQRQLGVGRARAGRTGRSRPRWRRTGTRPAAPSPPGGAARRTAPRSAARPDSSTSPAVGSISRVSSLANVVLPEPVSPTTATRAAAAIVEVDVGAAPPGPPRVGEATPANRTSIGPAGRSSAARPGRPRRARRRARRAPGASRRPRSAPR